MLPFPLLRTPRQNEEKTHFCFICIFDFDVKFGEITSKEGETIRWHSVFSRNASLSMRHYPFVGIAFILTTKKKKNL